MMKKGLAAAGAAALIILAGCRPMERITESDVPSAAETAEAAADTAAPEEMAAEPAPPVSGGETLTVESVSGVYTYAVDSWALYDSWEDAGISETQLSTSGYPVGAGGVALVTITQYCESRGELLPEAETMIVGGFQPVTRAQIDGAIASGDYEQYLYVETDMGFPASYLDRPGPSAQEYFYYPILNAGESAAYTLGFVLSASCRAAAEDGTLLLWYTANGMPESADELLLLPVK